MKPMLPDQSRKRFSRPARRLSDVHIRHPEGINRIWNDGFLPATLTRTGGCFRTGCMLIFC
ncbi:hypothetical protein Mpop_4652 [Methylorubrum populi BJ001]|uniref:Uncharacterized protein n=1 Tax=Methylorubrum populi (strain ATCC BAA-705 / NCIMB 13946 / BJ001) TaxID=441620 RepID=B1ZHZ3_METPB|nr:hypothetical protein Mpop_4652 [Methylorubrum populi BJ001]